MDETSDLAIKKWEKSLGADERGDPIWGLDVYRLSRFALDLAPEDGSRHLKVLPPEVRDQLLAAVAYALGSLREAVVWYSSLRDHLDSPTVTDRIALLSRVRRLLLGMLKATKHSRGGGSSGR